MIPSTVAPIDVMVYVSRLYLSGVALLIFIHSTNSISRSDEDVRQTLYNNVLLAGGNTMFPGLGERLKKELTFRAPSGTQVRSSKTFCPLITRYFTG